MSDQGSTPSTPPESGTLADQGVGTTQVIDLADIDLSGALPEEKKVAPPPLPPEEIARASQPPPRSAAPASMQPASLPPEGPAGRSTRFYVTVLVASLVAFVAVGALIARSMRSAPPSAAASAASARPAAGRVITINPVEMTDDVDAGAK
jgi:hypothetical protein